jgi:hypothetical protein
MAQPWAKQLRYPLTGIGPANIFHLLDLPAEILDRLYFETLRPDCGLAGHRWGCKKNHICIPNDIGTTKLLSLNREIHRQAVGLLHAHEHCFKLRRDACTPFRKMLAFGKPVFFQGSVRTSQCPVPPRFCELNLIGMKYLAFTIEYPLTGHGIRWNPSSSRLEEVPKTDGCDSVMAALIGSAREFEAVLWKCQSLKTLRLILHTDAKHGKFDIDKDPEYKNPEFSAIVQEDHPEMNELLGIFLNAAKCKNFKTAAEEDKTFYTKEEGYKCSWWWQPFTIDTYLDPLVEQYNHRAEDLGVLADFDHKFDKRLVKFEQEVNVRRRCREWCGAREEPSAVCEDPVDEYILVDCVEDEPEADDGQQDIFKPAPLPSNPRWPCLTPLDAPSVYELPDLPDNDIKEEEKTGARLKVYINEPEPPFTLRPECRKCFELFGSKGGLEHHLQKFSKRRIPFKRKAYNTLNYWAFHGGDRKCWTCAKSYRSLEQLNKHLDRYGHRREGMIPRWKRDNGWTNRRDGRRNAKRKEEQWRRLLPAPETNGRVLGE